MPGPESNQNPDIEQDEKAFQISEQVIADLGPLLDRSRRLREEASAKQNRFGYWPDFDIPEDRRSIYDEEIQNRFGFHKATIEGPNATVPQHSYLRVAFMEFADMLDRVLPRGRAKQVAFTELENASMWAHKAIAEQAPLSGE